MPFIEFKNINGRNVFPGLAKIRSVFSNMHSVCIHIYIHINTPRKKACYPRSPPFPDVSLVSHVDVGNGCLPPLSFGMMQRLRWTIPAGSKRLSCISRGFLSTRSNGRVRIVRAVTGAVVDRGGSSRSGATVCRSQVVTPAASARYHLFKHA